MVLQVAAKVGCKCYGIEKADIPAKFAEVNEFSASVVLLMIISSDTWQWL